MPARPRARFRHSHAPGRRRRSPPRTLTQARDPSRRARRQSVRPRRRAHAACRAGPARAPRRRLRLGARRDVVGRLPDALDLDRFLVRDSDPGAVLQLLNQRDEVERVGLEVLLEARVVLDPRWVYLQLLRKVAADELEYLIP